MEKQNISASINRDLLKRLDEIARHTERNRSWLISKAIEAYLEEMEDINIALQRANDHRLSPKALRKQIGL